MRDASNAAPAAIYFGDGAGGFGSPNWLAANPGTVFSVEIGDLDNDGDVDIVIASTIVGDGRLLTYLNNGAGAFAALPPQTIAVAPIIYLMDVALDDLNGDGVLDAAATAANADAVLVLAGTGDGGFAPPLALDASDPGFVLGGPVVVATGDVNGDGFPDLVAGVLTTGPDRVIVYSGHPAADWGVLAATDVSVGFANFTAPPALWVDDLDGDGRAEVVANVAVLRLDDEDAFETPTVLPVHEEALAAMASDTDGDGDLDLIITTRTEHFDSHAAVIENARAGAADLDSDGVVGPADLAALLGQWGDCPPIGACPGDLTGDGAADAGDLAAILAAWTT